MTRITHFFTVYLDSQLRLTYFVITFLTTLKLVNPAYAYVGKVKTKEHILQNVLLVANLEAE